MKSPMKTMTAIIAAGSAAAVSFALAGCGSKTETSASSPSAATSSAATSSNVGLPSERPKLEGAHKTINDYIMENKISEEPFKKDDPGTPDFDFPFPPDWRLAGDETPPWAYGAIIYDKPQDPSDPPTMIAIASKLTGNVDPAKILEYSPGGLENLPDFESLGEPKKTSLGGFDAVQSAGTFMDEDGKKRIVAQKTVVIPGNEKDVLFVMQLNAVALDGQQGVVIDAANLIDEQTKITPR